MRNDQVFDQVKNILGQVAKGVGSEEIHRETLLISDLHIDSLKIAEISILLEQSFRVPFFLPDLFMDRDPYKLTVASLVDYVKKEMKE